MRTRRFDGYLTLFIRSKHTPRKAQV